MDWETWALWEIFSFYARIHQAGIKDFEELWQKADMLDMGEFSVFSRDFEVPLKKSEVAKIFKKVADFRKKPLSYEQFVVAVDLIGEKLIKYHINKIQEWLAEIEKIWPEADMEEPIRMDTPQKSESEPSEKSGSDDEKSGSDDDKSENSGSKSEKSASEKSKSEWSKT